MWTMSFAYHDHAMGTAVYAGIREALDSLCTQGGPILACGRDVLEGARTMCLLYRAVDRDGNTVDFRLSPTRDVAAAKAFFRKALRTQPRAPVSIKLDGYTASQRAVREMPGEDEAWNHTKLRSSKYLNNLIEQDHRGIKSRTGPMLGFKNFDCAVITIAGGELLRRIRKGQFALGPLHVAAPAFKLLGRNVVGCPHNRRQLSEGEPPAAALGGDSEIYQLHRIVFANEDIFRFQIAMNNALAMNIFKRLAQPYRDLHRSVNRQSSLALQNCAQRIALNPFHCD